MARLSAMLFMIAAVMCAAAALGTWLFPSVPGPAASSSCTGGLFLLRLLNLGQASCGSLFSCAGLLGLGGWFWVLVTLHAQEAGIYEQRLLEAQRAQQMRLRSSMLRR